MHRYAPALKAPAARDEVSRALLTEIQEGRGIDGKGFGQLALTSLNPT